MPARPRKPAPTTDSTPTPDDPPTPDAATPDTPDEAAPVAAATAEVAKDAVTFDFRGATFTIPNARRGGAKMLTALRLVAIDPVAHTHRLLYAVLGKDDAVRIFDLLEDEENIFDVSAEFFEAMHAAAGTGNS
jgi:hypothetical protein